jgi:hypothetical protein
MDTEPQHVQADRPGILLHEPVVDGRWEGSERITPDDVSEAD